MLATITPLERKDFSEDVFYHEGETLHDVGQVIGEVSGWCLLAAAMIEAGGGSGSPDEDFDKDEGNSPEGGSCSDNEPEENPCSDKTDDASKSAAQMKKLSPGEIAKLKEKGIHPHDLKPNSKYDLFKDKDGDIHVKPRDGSGPGDPTGINLDELDEQ